MKALKLILGSGKPPLHPYHLPFVDKDHILIDKYIDHPEVIKMDVTDLKLPNDSCSNIYASHILEHISNTKIALDEWHRVLTPSGVIKILVPDLLWACQYMIQLDNNNENIEERCKPYYTTVKDVLNVIFGSRSRQGEYHYTGFTQKLLKTNLETSNFKILKMRTQFDSHHMQSIYVEAIAIKVSNL